MSLSPLQLEVILAGNCTLAEEKQNVKKNNARVSAPVANLEPAAGDESLATKKTQRLDRRCRVTVLSRRHRLADPGGCSSKYLIDAIVSAGLLQDDSTRYIQEPIIETQEKIPKIEQEETIITLEWED